MNDALLVDRVHKSFDKLEVLRGVELSVADHEVVCLIGASGSGKSTLLRCINLLEPIDAGRIVVEGTDITARGVDVNRVRRRIGIVFQAYNLFPHMSVLKNVTLSPRFFSSRRRHTRSLRDWSSDVCSSDLAARRSPGAVRARAPSADCGAT